MSLRITFYPEVIFTSIWYWGALRWKGFRLNILSIFPQFYPRSPLVGLYHAMNDTKKLNSVDAETTGRQVHCSDVFYLLTWVSTSGMWSWTGDVAEHLPSASLRHLSFLLCSFWILTSLRWAAWFCLGGEVVVKFNKSSWTGDVLGHHPKCQPLKI